MTVEASSFLHSTKITNSHEKSAKILQNHKNLIIFFLAFVLLLFCILASVLQIWVYSELNKAQAEIEQLKNDVQEIKSNELDHELLNEIAEFNRKYNNKNDVKDQIDLDEKISVIDDKVKFDDVGEDNDDNIDDTEGDDDDNYEGYHSGYGDEYDDDDYDLDELEDDLTLPEKVNGDDDNNIYKDMTKHIRKTRSITGITEQGVPILEEPYVSGRNRTKSSDLNRERNPKLRLTWDGTNRQYGHRRDYNHNNHHRYRQQHENTRHNHNFAFDAAPVHHTFESHGQKLNATSESKPIQMQTRQSRVMHFEDKTKAFRQVVGKDQLAKLREQRLPPIQHIQMPNGRKKVHQNMPLRRNLEMKTAKRMRITAVHFDGDSTKLEETRHHSYKGNGKVELNKNEYMHWKPADWVTLHGMEKFFQMDATGTLTANDHGIFLIYAQVYYSDNHDLNGYEIMHNNRVHYQCTTMTHTGSHGDPKTNSCYTSGLIHLRNGDKIKLRDVGNHRYVLMQPNKSFFGLIKINLLPSLSPADSTDIERFDTVK